MTEDGLWQGRSVLYSCRKWSVYWAGTREREDVVALLAADPYRAATL